MICSRTGWPFEWLSNATLVEVAHGLLSSVLAFFLRKPLMSFGIILAFLTRVLDLTFSFWIAIKLGRFLSRCPAKTNDGLLAGARSSG